MLSSLDCEPSAAHATPDTHHSLVTGWATIELFVAGSPGLLGVGAVAAWYSPAHMTRAQKQMIRASVARESSSAWLSRGNRSGARPRCLFASLASREASHVAPAGVLSGATSSREPPPPPERRATSDHKRESARASLRWHGRGSGRAAASPLRRTVSAGSRSAARERSSFACIALGKAARTVFATAPTRSIRVARLVRERTSA
mmetsp:Transcript_26032/g.83355  ORF Transcript_26032/g.83355 Transcript_26032/m.83355 type:complete len:203 (-) Transcript_26032:1211-1819(-)